MQADLAVALSAVLLNGDKGPSTQACNAALFYLRDAALKIGPTKVDNDLNRAQEQRLEQLVSAVATHVGGMCAWTNPKS